MNLIQASPVSSSAMGAGGDSNREPPCLGQPAALAAPAKPAAGSWRNRLRRFLCALDYMLARHHRLGWHDELDAEALEDRRRRLRAIEPGRD